MSTAIKILSRIYKPAMLLPLPNIRNIGNIDNIRNIRNICGGRNCINVGGLRDRSRRLFDAGVTWLKDKGHRVHHRHDYQQKYRSMQPINIQTLVDECMVLVSAYENAGYTVNFPENRYQPSHVRILYMKVAKDTPHLTKWFDVFKTLYTEYDMLYNQIHGNRWPVLTKLAFALLISGNQAFLNSLQSQMKSSRCTMQTMMRVMHLKNIENVMANFDNSGRNALQFSERNNMPDIENRIANIT